MLRAMWTAVFVLNAAWVFAQGAPAPKGLDTAAIDRAIGRSGQPMPGDVYRVSFPRSDLNVSVGSIKVRPQSWQEMFFPEIHGIPGN